MGLCDRKGAGKAAKAKPKTPVKSTTKTCPLASQTYGKAIKIEGDEKFRKKTIQALNDIRKTPTGKAMIESIEKSGKTVTIKPTKGTNNCDYTSHSDRFCEPALFETKCEKAGKGTSSVIKFDPDRTAAGTQPWETRPAAIGLAHELVHAEQAAYGMTMDGYAANDKRPDPADPKKTHQGDAREIEAVGIPPNDKRPFTENKIRSEWDPKQPERKWY
ncbi:MAG TPA: M91 family zinc metallopeptidase [Planctomycetota bacterium]|nr:M91 family zinc metallopeptidase [Planctomycetota bacterium]